MRLVTGQDTAFIAATFQMTSSLLEPDLNWMNFFHDLPHFCKVLSSQEIDTRRLDDIGEITGADYLKVDVQGAELDVLKGATQTLQDVLLVQTEIEFVPIYRNQPLFAEVDQSLRSHGFMFHKFVTMEGRHLEPFRTCRQLLGSPATDPLVRCRLHSPSPRMESFAG
jgi:Methyltransferase FkbM domain